MGLARRYPVGAEVTSDGTHLRVWAPRRERVEVCHGEGLRASSALGAEPDGYFAGLIPELRPGGR